MNDISLPGNRHPVDALADIRAQIKSLQIQEKSLAATVSELMGDSDSLGGDQFIAMQKITTRKGSIDQKLMEASGVDPDAFRKPESTVFSIRLEARVMEAG